MFLGPLLTKLSRSYERIILIGGRKLADNCLCKEEAGKVRDANRAGGRIDELFSSLKHTFEQDIANMKMMNVSRNFCCP